MTSEDRQRVRAAIDAHKRDHLKRPAFARACAGCGRDRAGCNPDCQTCKARRAAKWKRELEKGTA